MKLLIALALLLAAIPASASRIYICAPNDATVPHRVIKYLTSADTPKYISRNDVLINLRARDIPDAPQRRLVGMGGDGINTPYTGLRKMTAAERAAMVVAQLARQQDIQAQSALLSGPPADRPVCRPASRSAIFVTHGRGRTADICHLCVRTSRGRYEWLIIPFTR